MVFIIGIVLANYYYGPATKLLGSGASRAFAPGIVCNVCAGSSVCWFLFLFGLFVVEQSIQVVSARPGTSERP